MFAFQIVGQIPRPVGHNVTRGAAATRNPYRTGEVVHPAEVRGPVGRTECDAANQHATHPAR